MMALSVFHKEYRRNFSCKTACTGLHRDCDQEVHQHRGEERRRHLKYSSELGGMSQMCFCYVAFLSVTSTSLKSKSESIITNQMRTNDNIVSYYQSYVQFMISGSPALNCIDHIFIYLLGRESRWSHDCATDLFKGV